MGPINDYLWDRWLAVALLVVGALLMVITARRRQTAFWFGLTLAVFGIGGLSIPHPWGLYAAGAALGLLVVMFVYLLYSTRWWAVPATALGVILVAGLGSWAA